MSQRNRVFRVFLLFIVGFAVILAIGSVSLTRYAEKAGRQELKKLNAEASVITINLFARTITLEDIQWSYSDESVLRLPHRLHVKKVKISGVNMYQFLFNKKIYIKKFSIEGGNFQYNKILKFKRKHTGSKQIMINGLLIQSLELKNINTTLFR
jgi:hypothetical protein